MIEMKNISKAYGEKQVLNHFSLILPEGEITALMGPSGSGKTTVLRLLLGLEAPDSGTISGLENSRKSAVFQEDRLCEGISPIANLRLAAPHLSREEAASALKEVGIEENSHDVATASLSGGMKRRVAILRALLAPFAFLVADEPFSGLDEDTKNRVMDYFHSHVQGKTVLLITHDAGEAQRLASNTIRLDSAENPFP